MAIRLKNLERIAKTYTEQSYLYKDLALDLTQTTQDTPGYPLPVPGTDIKASFDLGAIKNSLQNLFNTKPGQRFLFPEYGLNLDQFLFQPITEANGNVLGNKIFTTINSSEPRVRVSNVQVFLDPDNNQYLINILLDVPSLNVETVIESVLDIKKQSFIVLPTSRNR
jgi:phage baseplate assembly protein W